MSIFYVKNEQIYDDRAVILGDDVKHIRNVLRYKVDDKLEVCDESGMRYFTKILLFVVALLVVVPDCEARPNVRRKERSKYDVFLLIGQSNMAGRGKLLEADTLKDIKGVWLLNSEGKPEPARNPLNKYSSIRKSYKMQQMSPGYSFATKVHKATGRKLLLVHMRHNRESHTYIA